jgi:hypothetical protein
VAHKRVGEGMEGMEIERERRIEERMVSGWNCLYMRELGKV